MQAGSRLRTRRLVLDAIWYIDGLNGLERRKGATLFAVQFIAAFFTDFGKTHFRPTARSWPVDILLLQFVPPSSFAQLRAGAAARRCEKLDDLLQLCFRWFYYDLTGHAGN